MPEYLKYSDISSLAISKSEEECMNDTHKIGMEDKKRKNNKKIKSFLLSGFNIFLFLNKNIPEIIRIAKNTNPTSIPKIVIIIGVISIIFYWLISKIL